jgi:RNA polymerase sigma-70 factor (ECF subfamily)
MRTFEGACGINVGPMESGDLSERVGRAVEAAEAEWPGWRLPREVFAKRLIAIIEVSGKDPGDALSSLRLGDLYLALGCAHRVPGAMKAFASKHLSRLAECLGGFKDPQTLADDVRRELEDTLLLGRKGSPPRIGQYTGHGPLNRYVAAAARNAALTLMRQRGQERRLGGDEDTGLVVSPPASAKELVTSRHDAAIRDAVRTSLSKLDRRQRTIVRLHLSQGVTLTQIARMLHVHQTTVSRALDDALERMYSDIRRRLREEHGLDDAEMESIVRDMRSHVDLSLSRVLGDTGEAL